ncbi:MAG: hypothetical protein PHF86_10420 [Candidatus Nanoarchaeia archaeon]|nr:hypothetical protein [Candidatus Nanoarchaeia archaeon]
MKIDKNLFQLTDNTDLDKVVGRLMYLVGEMDENNLILYQNGEENRIRRFENLYGCATGIEDLIIISNGLNFSICSPGIYYRPKYVFKWVK